MYLKVSGPNKTYSPERDFTNVYTNVCVFDNLYSKLGNFRSHFFSQIVVWNLFLS